MCSIPAVAAALALASCGAPGGVLSVYPANPSYFRAPDGKPLLLLGDYVWGPLCQVGYDYEPMLDTLHAAGLNFARVGAFWGTEYLLPPVDRKLVTPYLRPGPGLAADGKPKYDLSRFNPAFFDRLRALADAARERGIYLQVTLIDAWGIKHADLWRLHAFARGNNINGVDGDPARTGKGTDGKHGFCSMGNPKCLRYQKLYIRHVVEALADRGNILYEIANENYYNRDWELELCRYIHELEADMPLHHLVVPLDLPHHDYDAIKTFNTATLAANLLKARALKTPIIWDTDGLGCPADEVVRKAAWTAVCNGGNVDYWDQTFKVGTQFPGDVHGSKAKTLRAQLSHLAAFVKSFRFWETHPAPERVLSGTAYALASGSELVAYLPKGGQATIDVSDMKGPFTARWFDPRTGKLGKAVRMSGGKLDLKAPDDRDWAVHVTW